MDEPWGIGYEDPVAMQYIEPNLNSQWTPNVLPLRASKCVSLLRRNDPKH